MSRRFVTDLVDGETVDQVFSGLGKAVAAEPPGNLYLQMRLSDKTGSINAMVWNADQRLYEALPTAISCSSKGPPSFTTTTCR